MEFYSDFRHDSRGEGAPFNWARFRGTRPSILEIISDSAFTSGRVFRQTPPDDGHHGVFYGPAGEERNQEVAFRWYVGTEQGSALAELRIEETDVDWRSYMLDMNPEAGVAQVWYYDEGSFTRIQGKKLDYDFKRSTWYRTRYRAEGINLYVKIWPDNKPEPDGWMLHVVDQNLDEGRVGLGSSAKTTDQTFEFNVDWVGIGTRGDSAPTEITTDEDKDRLHVVGPGNIHVPHRVGTFNISQRLNACDNATFTVTLKPDETLPLQVGQQVHVYRTGALEDKFFAGTVERYREYDMRGTKDYTRRVVYSLVCFSALAERYLVAEAYEEVMAGDIVKSLVSRYLSGERVTTDNVQEGIPVNEVNFNWVRLSEALNELGELTGYSWWIDHDRGLHFVDRGAHQAPFGITDVNRPYSQMRIQQGRREYRNRQTIRAGKDLTTLRTERFRGDGEQKVFTTAFPLGKVPTISLNGEEQEVGIHGVDENRDFYWNKESREIIQDDGDEPLSDSDLLEVEYRGMYPIIVRADAEDEISERQAVEGGTGVYERIESEPNINNSQFAMKRAQGMLRRYGEIQHTVEFETDRTELRKGQLITIRLTAQGLNGDYLIDEVEWFDREDGRLRQRVVCLSGESFGGWTKFFRELQQQGRSFTIRENEVLILLRTITESLFIRDEVEVEVDVQEPPEPPEPERARVGSAKVGQSNVE